MKRATRLSLISLSLAALLPSISGGDQPQVNFYKAAQGTFNADWQGVAGRTYFMEFSIDLVDWHFAPFIDFGDGLQSRGIETNAVRFFLRLNYGDYPGIDSLDDAMNADQDADGLSNIFEVTHGYDPFEEESTIDGLDADVDPDQDGLGNAAEQAAGTNPMAKDNSLLMLSVSVD